MSVATFPIIFSQSEGCLFTLLIVCFEVQKLLRLIRPHFDETSRKGRLWLPGAEGGRKLTAGGGLLDRCRLQNAVLIIHFQWADSTVYKLFFNKTAFKGTRGKQQQGRRCPQHSSLLPRRPEMQKPVSKGAKTEGTPLAGQWSTPGFLTQGVWVGSLARELGTTCLLAKKQKQKTEAIL